MLQLRDNEAITLGPGPSPLDFNSPVPLYHQLTAYLEERIKSREWRPLQYLPSEQDLCDYFGVSRTVVRQAMSILAQKGLITKKSGKRTMVAEPTFNGAAVQDLKGFFEAAVSRGQRPYTRVLELRVIPASPEVAGALQIKEGEMVVMLNRLRFLDGVPEVLVVTYLPERLCPGLTEEDFSNQSLYAVLARRYGHVVERGYRSIEAIGLDEHQAKLLESQPGSPALLLKSVGMLADSTPLEYYVAVHRGDKAKFHVQLVRAPEAAAGQSA